MNPNNLIPIVAMMIPIIIVPTSLAFRHARYLRDVEHSERMKAMELGRTLPGDEMWTTPGRVVVSIGAFLPIASLFLAFIASNALGFHAAIWAACGSVGVVGVIGGTVLASKHLFASNEAGPTVSKPSHDPDAFDVVSQRG